MNVLRRTDFRPDGIYGEFQFNGDASRFCVTLEHSYGGEPKVQSGVYTCVRGTHALSNGVPFETFEITGVTGHSGILFHAGNYNRDSEGCILIGKEVVHQPDSTEMITGSRDEFAQWLARLAGTETFQLEVI